MDATRGVELKLEDHCRNCVEEQVQRDRRPEAACRQVNEMHGDSHGNDGDRLSRIAVHDAEKHRRDGDAADHSPPRQQAAPD